MVIAAINAAGDFDIVCHFIPGCALSFLPELGKSGVPYSVQDFQWH